MNRSVERALLARPLALCLGALAAVWLSAALRTGPLVVWIVGLTAGPNLILWLARDMRFVSRVAYIASPIIGLLGWGALATFTQGLESPFLAAFFIEVALAGVSMMPLGVLGVTASAIGVLLGVQSLFGLASGWQLWLFEAAALAVMGGLGFGVARRRETGERLLREQGDELGERLDALQRELEDERVVSRVGENVARLAHGLKNAVHSLRGFVGLIEPQLEGGDSSSAALAGLRTTIDELEKLARLTLSETGPAAALDAGSSARVVQVLEEACREIRSASPAVEWEVEIEDEARDLVIPIGETPFLELLVILMRNAVEAMGGEGRAKAEVSKLADQCVLTISDEGEGIAPEVEEQIFAPGYTTKSKGSGFGLFLARRIVQDHGGALALRSGEDKGAVVRVEIPIARTGLNTKGEGAKD